MRFSYSSSSLDGARLINKKKRNIMYKKLTTFNTSFTFNMKKNILCPGSCSINNINIISTIHKERAVNT